MMLRTPRGRPTGGRIRPQAGFAVARFPLSESIFGTARSRPGRAGCARRRKIFSGVEKIFRSAPWTVRTVLEDGAEGKAGRRFQGVSPWRGSGAAPRAPYRARFWRAALRISPAPSGRSPTSGRRMEWGVSGCPRPVEAGEKLPFGALHGQRGFGIGLGLGEALQLRQRDPWPQATLAARRFPE